MPDDILIPFADAVLEAARQVRDDEASALILILNLRFVKKTRASLGMQRYDRTGLVDWRPVLPWQLVSDPDRQPGPGVGRA